VEGLLEGAGCSKHGIFYMVCGFGSPDCVGAQVRFGSEWPSGRGVALRNPPRGVFALSIKLSVLSVLKFSIFITVEHW